MAVSVVVPVYNGAPFLRDLMAQVTQVLRDRGAAYEIILVNDGSRDDSWPAIAELASTDHHVRGLNLMRNYGQHNALLAGIRGARHNVIVTMDDEPATSTRRDPETSRGAQGRTAVSSMARRRLSTTGCG